MQEEDLVGWKRTLVYVYSYRDRLKGMQILLSRTQADHVSKSSNKFLATTYKPFSRSLYVSSGDSQSRETHRAIDKLVFYDPLKSEEENS